MTGSEEVQPLLSKLAPPENKPLQSSAGCFVKLYCIWWCRSIINENIRKHIQMNPLLGLKARVLHWVSSVAKPHVEQVLATWKVDGNGLVPFDHVLSQTRNTQTEVRQDAAAELSEFGEATSNYKLLEGYWPSVRALQKVLDAKQFLSQSCDGPEARPAPNNVCHINLSTPNSIMPYA